MAKLTKFSIKLNWEPSVSTDTAGYRLYFETDPTLISYDCPYVTSDLVTGNEFILTSDSPIITEFPTVDSTGLYVGITTVDKFGNESDIVVTKVEVDFTPPKPVTNFLSVLLKS